MSSPTVPLLVLVQHCQGEHHVNNLRGGSTNSGLTPLGRQQAKCVGDRLARELSQRPVYLPCDMTLRTVDTRQVAYQHAVPAFSTLDRLQYSG